MEGKPTRTVDSLLFRTGGNPTTDARPGLAGKGFLIDNLTPRPPRPGAPCTFTTNGKIKTMTLVANCTTDTTIVVPDGYTLDGNGHKITAVDRPTGASFDGAVVQNDGAAMNVKNLTIEGGVPNNCVATFNGVAFMNAGGSIKNVTLNNIGQTTGCQSGRAIVVWNSDASAHGGQSRSRTTPSPPTTRTGSTCAATSMRRSPGTP